METSTPYRQIGLDKIPNCCIMCVYCNVGNAELVCNQDNCHVDPDGICDLFDRWSYDYPFGDMKSENKES